MAVTRATIELAKVLEGTKGGKPALKPYRDIAGVWTNGYGNTRGVTRTTPPITPEQAERDLIQHLDEADDIIAAHVTVPLNENQRGALQLFILNIGWPKFVRSTLLKRLNARDYTGAGKQFMLWIKFTNPETGKLEDSNGLINRRTTELGLWTTPVPGRLLEQALLQGVDNYTDPNPVDVVQPVEPPQPQSAMGTSTGRVSATALGTGVAGAVASAEPIAHAVRAFSGINLSAIAPVLVLVCIVAIAWLLWDRQRKVTEDGR